MHKCIEADWVLLNGKVLTVDSQDTVAEAIAIRDSKIQIVGTTEEVQRLSGVQTKVLDLEGNTVTPGFIDCHNHTMAYGFSFLRRNLRYSRACSIEEIKRAVKERTEKLPPGIWIWDICWDGDKTTLEEKRYPVRSDLDPISPEHPFAVIARAGFFVVNSVGLRILLVGVDPKEEPQDGIIRRGHRLYGRIQSSVYGYPVEDLEKAILKAQKELFKMGVTAQKEAGADDSMIQAYRNLHARGKLTLRSFLLYNLLGRTTVANAQEVVAKYQPVGDDILMLGGVKCSYDRSISKRGPWLYEEWNKNVIEKDEFNLGGLSVSDPQLHGEIVKILHRAGFQVATHCHGDQAIDRYIDEIEAAIIDIPKTNCRHSVVHGTLLTDYALRKLGKLGDNIVVEASAAYLYFLGDRFYSNFGPYRSRRLIPLRTLFERGIVVGTGADYSACDINPIYGLYAACTRKPRDEVCIPDPFGTDECLTISQALRLYTINSAYCLFWEDKIGSLEPGKYADLVVWSGDFYNLPPEEWLNLQVEMTMVNGEIVYKNNI